MKSFPKKTAAAVAVGAAVTAAVMTTQTPVAPLVTGHPTNQPPSLTLAWNPSDANWQSFTVVEGHASGVWDVACVTPTNEITFTNINPRQPYVFAVSQMDSNGQSSPFSVELWWNVASNGMVYSVKGREYAGFAQTNWGATNFTWAVAPVRPDGAAFWSNRTTTNAFAQVALPAPGFYRITRQ